MERKMSQPNKIKWTTRGDGNYTTSESSDDELMEDICKECIMKCKKSLNANEAANEELAVVQQDKAIVQQDIARPLLRVPWQAKSVCKSKAVQQGKIRPRFRVPWQEKTVSQVKAEQQGKTLSLFQAPWQTKTVQQGEPGPLLQVSKKNPTFNEVAKEENVIVEQGKEIVCKAIPLLLVSLKNPTLKFIKTFGWLPTANESDVHKFFSEDQGFKIAQIFFHDVNGYSRGACFIEFQNEENVNLAMRKDRQHYGERFIMVSRVDKIDYNRLICHVEKNKPYANMSFILISGFNEKVTEKDVIAFFGEIPIEKFFLSNKTCEAFIKLKRKTDEETVLIKGHFAKLDGSFVKLQRINGVTFYELIKGIRQGEMLNESKVMDENENQTYEAPKIDVKDWQNMVERAHKTLKLIQEMVPEDDYIIQTLIKNLGNYLNMFDQKFQNDADARQNMMKEIQELKNQKKKEKSNQE